VNYVFTIPATVTVNVHGSSTDEERAFADAIQKVREHLEPETGHGVAIEFSFRKAKTVAKHPDPDCRD
jgi:hypothetical protein